MANNGTTNGQAAKSDGPTLNAEQLAHQQQLRQDEIIINALMARQNFLKGLLDPRRDINAECGFPTTISVDDYRLLYEREAIAARVVEVMPRESWQVQPTIYEDESADKVTEFEKAWDDLARTLRGEKSYYQDEAGSPVWEYLQRADELSGIGHYGILLLGIDDGLTLDTPAAGLEDQDGSPKDVPGVDTAPGDPAPPPQPYTSVGTDSQYGGLGFAPRSEAADRSSVEGRSGDRPKLLYLRTFDEGLAQVVQYESDPTNSRNGMPVMYMVTLNDPRFEHAGVGLAQTTQRVHWSRVIHLADNLTSSEVFGTPRMKPVFNHLLNLRKLYHAGPEGYWKSCFTGLAFETHPQLGGDVKVNLPGLKDQVENYQNGLQRALILMGMSAKTLAPSVVDPTGQINCQLEAIAIKLEMPMRILKGSERGELASGQDDASWNDRKKRRQMIYLTPRVIIPFVDRLISLGILPEPGGKGKPKDQQSKRAAKREAATTNQVTLATASGYGLSPDALTVRGQFVGVAIRNAEGKVIGIKAKGGYSIEWPDLTSESAAEKATVATQVTQALVQFISGGGEQMMTPLDFLTRILKMDEEEAGTIIEAAVKAQEDKAAEQADQQAAQPGVPGAPGGPPSGFGGKPGNQFGGKPPAGSTPTDPQAAGSPDEQQMAALTNMAKSRDRYNHKSTRYRR